MQEWSISPGFIEDSAGFKKWRKIVPRHLINNIHHVVGMPDFLSDRER